MQRRVFLGLLPALVAGFKNATIKYTPKLAEKLGFYGYLEEGRVVIDRSVFVKIDFPVGLVIHETAEYNEHGQPLYEENASKS